MYDNVEKFIEKFIEKNLQIYGYAMISTIGP